MLDHARQLRDQLERRSSGAMGVITGSDALRQCFVAADVQVTFNSVCFTGYDHYVRFMFAISVVCKFVSGSCNHALHCIMN